MWFSLYSPSLIPHPFCFSLSFPLSFFCFFRPFFFSSSCFSTLSLNPLTSFLYSPTSLTPSLPLSCFSFLFLISPTIPIPPRRYNLCYAHSLNGPLNACGNCFKWGGKKRELNHSIGSQQVASIAEKCPRLPWILKHWWRTDFLWQCEFPSVQAWQRDCLAWYYSRRFDTFPV